MDPFNDIAPMICNLTPEYKSISYSRDYDEDEADNDEVWGPPGDERNIFDLIDHFDDEEN